MSEMKCKRCGANENRIHGFCSMECRTAWEYEDDIRDLTARIAELEEKQRWIPVSERLPEDKKHYMAVVINCFNGSREIYRLRYYGDGNWFSWASESNAVTHWKEEPELPESPNDTQTDTFVYGKESEE